MKAKKRKARMGRPPVPIDQARLHPVKINLTTRELHLLEEYHKQRPHLKISQAARELMSFMLEIMGNPEVGISYMAAELIHSEGVAADKSQAEIDFATGAVVRETIDILRDPKMEKRLNKALKMPLKNPDTVLHFKD